MGFIKSWHRKEKAIIKEDTKEKEKKRKEFLLKYYELALEHKMELFPKLNFTETTLSAIQGIIELDEGAESKIKIIMEELKK